MSRQKFRPLSFSTTIRNPHRIYEFLGVINDFEGQDLTVETIITIESELIKRNIYKPIKVNDEISFKRKMGQDLSDEDVNLILEMNPQSHKEAGFKAGWPSRFATHYMPLYLLGLIKIKPGEKIQITKKGEQVVNDKIGLIDALKHSIENVVIGNSLRPGTANKQQIFKTLEKALELKTELNFEEFYALCCAKDSSEESINELINNPTKEGIEAHWYQSFNDGAYEKRKETVDDILRKLHLTGLIKIEKSPSLRVTKNHKFSDVVSDNTAINDEDYWELMSSPLEVEAEIQKSENNDFLSYWDALLTREDCAKLLYASASKAKIHIEQLSYVPKFVILEMAVGLILRKDHPDATVVMNLHYDDNFTPTAPASGGFADITIESHGIKTNVEVTLLKGVAQHHKESQSTIRHTVDSGNEQCLLIAPSISRDTAANYQFEIPRRSFKLSAVNIASFIKLSSNNTKINEIVKSSHKILKDNSLFDDDLTLRVNNI